LKPHQPRKPLSDPIARAEYMREVETLHKRLNELIISPAVVVLVATKANYVNTDVTTAAEVAAAMNTLAAAVNLQAAAINSLLARLNAT